MTAVGAPVLAVMPVLAGQEGGDLAGDVLAMTAEHEGAHPAPCWAAVTGSPESVESADAVVSAWLRVG